MRHLVALIVLAIGLVGLFLGWRAERRVKEHFAPVAAEARGPADLAVRLNREVHRMHREYAREVEGRGETDDVQDVRYRLVDHILDHGGLCAHRALLLITALRQYDIPARKRLLLDFWESGEPYACHVAAEAYIDGRWRVLDPLFGYAFTRPDGALATAEELGRNPEWVTRLARADADPFPFAYPVRQYDYDDTALFNWWKTGPTAALGRAIGPAAAEWEPPILWNHPYWIAGYLFTGLGLTLVAIELAIGRRRYDVTATATGAVVASG